VRSPLAVAKIDNFYHVFGRGRELVFKACYLDFVVGVFLDLQLLFAVKQVTDFATINLEEAHVKLGPSGCKLE
jgi:hypothetical protein